MPESHQRSRRPLAGKMKPGQKKILAGLASSFVLLAVLVLVLPVLQSAFQWYFQAPPQGQLSIANRKDLVQGAASAFQAVAVLIAGLVGLAGLYFTSLNLQQTRKHTDRQLEQAEQGQITDRFTSAIAQLGSDKLELRLGGIYALERIAEDSLAMENSPGRDYASIMEVLTAYVRENAPRSPNPSKEENLLQLRQRLAQLPPLTRLISWRTAADKAPRGDTQGKGDAELTSTPARPEPPADIQAILAVLRRLKQDRVPREYRVTLNLRETDLPGANLGGADLRRADLVNTNLQGANLRAALLVGADLRKTDLRKADLVSAELRDADLRGANLQGAYLGFANLQGADLREVQNLTKEQINAAIR